VFSPVMDACEKVVPFWVKTNRPRGPKPLMYRRVTPPVVQVPALRNPT